MTSGGGAGARCGRKSDLAARAGSTHDAPALPAMMPSFACPALRELVVAVGNGTHVGLSVKLPVTLRDLARGVVCIPFGSVRGRRPDSAQRHANQHSQRPPLELSRRVEGAGTRPDYLVNRDDLNNEGPFEEKNAQKSRNNCRMNSRSCGCIGTVDSGPKCAHS